MRLKPVIGVLMRPAVNENQNEIYVLYKKVEQAITEFGGICLAIAPNYKVEEDMKEESLQDMLSLVDMCDGIILQGGDDFYDYDVKITQYLYEHDIPTLGICLGMQTMSVVCNGVETSVADSSHLVYGTPYAHLVTLDTNSKLYSILETEEFMVNSRHKSCIVSTELSIVGRSEDGMIEAVEDASKKFFIGVQWHPEAMIAYDVVARKLFTYFLDTCQMR